MLARPRRPMASRGLTTRPNRSAWCHTQDQGSDSPCTTGVVTNVFEYTVGTQTHAFNRPVGLAVAPTLRIKTPRFRDHVARTAEVSVGWNSAADRLIWRLVDLGPASLPSGATQVFSGSVSLATTTRAWAKSVLGLAQTAANQLQAGRLFESSWRADFDIGLDRH